jgi:hypothetical protein
LELFGKPIKKYIPAMEVVDIIISMFELVRQVKLDEHARIIDMDKNACIGEVKLSGMSHYNCFDPGIIPLVIDRARRTFFQQLVDIENTL